ncbi:MAG TPA: DUF4293 domain-containing protein [Prolixibacteraceae bacterium]
MIQRIQTLYLLAADLLVSALFLLPFAELSGKEGKLFLFHLTGLITWTTGKGDIVLDTWPLLVITCLIAALLIVVIFQYKNRQLQIKLSYLAVFLLVGLTGLIYFYVWKGSALTGGTYSFKVCFTFPLIAAVFVWLATRGIIKDENLVKSIDRIR